MSILITGIAGQDGLILARKLQKRGTSFWGTCRKDQATYVSNLLPDAKIIQEDLAVPGKITDLLKDLRPKTIFNLAGFSSVRDSWKNKDLTYRINYEMPREIIDWIQKSSTDSQLIQAVSSEIFAGINSSPQNESSLISPTSPYGESKALIQEYLREIRIKSDLRLSSAIMYNHESPLRPDQYVSRHISKSIARIFLGLDDSVKIGNLYAKRDWGWAPEYMDALILISEQDSGDDFIVASGIVNQVLDLMRFGFQSIGIKDFSSFIETQDERLRSIDSQTLVGDPRHIFEICGWKPTLKIEEGIAVMIKNDIELLKKPGKNTLSWLE